MVVLEAWAKGRPVVAHRIGALPELITHGVNGFLADPDNTSELAAVLESTFQAGQSLAAMGRNGQERLQTHHHKSVWLDKMIQVYRNAGLL